VKNIERVDFPEALRMLAERAGVALESPPDGRGPRGASKTEIYAVNEWAKREFAAALTRSPEVLAYVQGRGISPASIEKFVLGHPPEGRDWLSARARRDGWSIEDLVAAGLVVRSQASPGLTRDRFRGRLMFPIHDPRGRTLGFGGRILPSTERALAA